MHTLADPRLFYCSDEGRIGFQLPSAGASQGTWGKAVNFQKPLKVGHGLVSNHTDFGVRRPQGLNSASPPC